MYLAEHVLTRYRHVIWVVPEDVSPKSRYFGFSHKWDTQVLSLASQIEIITEKLYEAENECEACVFFDENESLYDLLPSRTKTALFLDPYCWHSGTSRAFAKKCTYTFSTSPFVTKKIVKPNLLANEHLCPFDSVLRLIPRAQAESGAVATLLYPAYGMSFLERQCLKQISEIVKACCPDSKSVISYYDAKGVSELGMDAKVYDWKLLEYLKLTDWIIDLNSRPLMGLFCSFAGALAIPWSGFDIPPNTDEYSAARRYLIPFPEGGLVLNNAEEIAGHIVRHLTTPFNGYIDRNKGAGAYRKRLEEFTKTINHLLDTKSK
jgi:hypothetical protein